MSAQILVRGLRKEFPKVLAVDGVDLDVAERHRTLGIRKEFDNPIAAGDLVLFGRSAGTPQAHESRLRVQLGDASTQGSFGIVDDELQHTAEASVVIRVEIETENAGKQDGVIHLELSELHVSDEFADDGRAVESGFA